MNNKGPETALLFDLLRDLKQVFPTTDFSGHACPSWDARTFAAHLQTRTLLKKYCPTSEPSQAACRVALSKFEEVNDRCKTWSIRPGDYTEKEAEILGLFKDELYRFWYRSDGITPLVSSLTQLFEAGWAGPGASISAAGCDFYTKYLGGPLSASSDGLLATWKHLVSKNPIWSTAERLRPRRDKDVVTRRSKLSFVNKNVDVARSICTEPSVNMWFQLGLGSVIGQRLKGLFGIDIQSQQQVQQLLAQEGSLGGAFCTIDLRSASDSVSLGLCEWSLPRDFLNWLLLLRSETTVTPNGVTLELGMLSSMGNGYTFPLQTLIFASVVRAVYRFHGVAIKSHGAASERNLGVFGDDIICYSSLYGDVVRVLSLLGFEVNSEKSFNDGPFRESCGGDFHSGVPVRPVYIKDLSTDQQVFVAINSLTLWSARHSIPLTRTMKRLFRMVKGPVYRVPPGVDMTSGVWVPAEMRSPSHSPGHDIVAYAGYQAVAREMTIREDGIISVKVGGKEKQKGQMHYEGGVVALLYGCIRGMRISVRQREVRYRVRLKHTSVWDSWHDLASSWVPGDRPSPPAACVERYPHWSHWLGAARENLLPLLKRPR